MFGRLGPLAVALTLAALFAVGCGDDNKSSSGSGGSSTPAETSGGTSTDSSGGSSGGTDLSNNPQVKAAIEQCQQAIDTNPAVKDDIKPDLKKICEKAASGNPEDVKAATKEVCTKIVESSVPAGAARDTALSACDSAGG